MSPGGKRQGGLRAPGGHLFLATEVRGRVRGRGQRGLAGRGLRLPGWGYWHRGVGGWGGGRLVVRSLVWPSWGHSSILLAPQAGWLAGWASSAAPARLCQPEAVRASP